MGALSTKYDLSDMPYDVRDVWDKDRDVAVKKPKEFVGKEKALGHGWGMIWETNIPPGEAHGRLALKWTLWKGTERVWEEYACWMPKELPKSSDVEIQRQWNAHKAFETGA